MIKGGSLIFLYGVIIGSALILSILNCIIFFTTDPTNTGQINVTILDKDSSDFTIYSDTKNIYTTNKYEWKTLEINHTYQCDNYYSGISNCKEISL